MTVHFTVTGYTVSEIEEDAVNRLTKLSGEGNEDLVWVLNYDIYPHTVSVDAQTLLWEVSVHAECLGHTGLPPIKKPLDT